ncbi:MAG: hypothetical protein ACLQIB_47005 [Isosphaeraceae bacterium]
MSPIFLGVEAFHPAQNVLSDAMGIVAPFRESLDAGSIVIAGLKRPAGGLESSDRVLNPLARQTRQPGRGDGVHNLPGNVPAVFRGQLAMINQSGLRSEHHRDQPTDAI